MSNPSTTNKAIVQKADRYCAWALVCLTCARRSRAAGKCLRSHRAYPTGNGARWWRCCCGYSRYFWSSGEGTHTGFRTSQLALHLLKKGENSMTETSEVWTGKAISYDRVRPTPPPALLDQARTDDNVRPKPREIQFRGENWRRYMSALTNLF
jgi:hypothetical protein